MVRSPASLSPADPLSSPRSLAQRLLIPGTLTSRSAPARRLMIISAIPTISGSTSPSEVLERCRPALFGGAQRDQCPCRRRGLDHNHSLPAGQRRAPEVGHPWLRPCGVDDPVCFGRDRPIGIACRLWLGNRRNRPKQAVGLAIGPGREIERIGARFGAATERQCPQAIDHQWLATRIL